VSRGGILTARMPQSNGGQWRKRLWGSCDNQGTLEEEASNELLGCLERAGDPQRMRITIAKRKEYRNLRGGGVDESGGVIRGRVPLIQSSESPSS